MTLTLCTSCPTEPEPGVFLEPREARHTMIVGDGGDGPEPVCTFCATDLLFRIENRGTRGGSRVTLTVTPALAEAVA